MKKNALMLLASNHLTDRVECPRFHRDYLKFAFAAGFLLFMLFLFLIPKKAFASEVLTGGFTELEAKRGGQQRKIVYVNNNWYAFYQDASTVFYKKSSDGISWGSAVTLDSTSSPISPTAWVEGTTIYAAWIRDTEDSINVNTIDTASSDALGTQCTSSDLGTFIALADFVSLAVADNGAVYAAVGGSTTAVVVNLTFSGCTFTDITTGSGLTTGDVPATTTIGNNFQMVFQNGSISHSIYNGTSWIASGNVIDLDTDTFLSLATDGTNLWLLTVDSSTATAFYICASCASSSTWLLPDAPWAAETNVTAVSLTYDSTNSDLWAFAITDTSEQAYYKSIDAPLTAPVSWGSETAFTFTAGNLGHVSSPETAAGKLQIAVTLRQGTNYEFLPVNQNPSDPTSLGPAVLVDGSYTTDSTPTLTFTLSDPDSADTVKYRIQIDDSSDFSSAVVDYTSALAAQGSASFTVGQAAGSGSYTAGSDGQTLPAASYYFRVKAIDDDTAESAYTAANSGAIAFKVFAVDLDSPQNNGYTNSERPSFKWRPAVDSGAGLSKYVLAIDNPSIGSSQPSGDFTIDNIPTSGTADVSNNRYVIHFEGFSDSDSTNNYISVYTKSHGDWGTSENDGKLREGRVGWQVKAVDSAGNETAATRTLFVDKSGPKTEILRINNILYSSTAKKVFNTVDQTPTIFGKITDMLAGPELTEGQTQDENGPKVASGPKSAEVKIEKIEGLTTKIHTIYTINMDKPWYTCNNKEVADNSKQKCDKYLPFEFTPKQPLPTGSYKITVRGKDNADNTSSTSLNLNIISPTRITAPEEEKPVEEGFETTKQEEAPKPETFGGLRADIANFVKNVFRTLSSGIGYTFNLIDKGLAFGADKIGDGFAYVFGKAGQGFGTTGNWYNNLAQKAQGVAKTVLAGIRSGVSTATQALGNFAGAIADASTKTTNNTKESAADIAFGTAEKTPDVPEGIGLTLVKFGYLFVVEPTKIYDVEVADLTSTSVKISWRTNHPANGKINWGFDTTYPFDVQTDKRTTYHEFALTDLKPDTEYHFEVMSQNKNYVYDANRTFKTPKE